LTQHSVHFALQHYDMFTKQVARIKADREHLLNQLSALDGVQVWQSQANFLLFRVEQAEKVFIDLKTAGILIKCVHGRHPSLDNCLQVTVGNPEDNEAFLKALTQALLHNSSEGKNMNRQYINKLSVLSLWLIVQTNPSLLHAEGLIYEGFWTNDINPDNASRQIYIETAPVGGPLYLCMRIKGEKDMLDIFRESGSLPLQPTRHKWIRYIGTRPFFEEAQKPINVIGLPSTNLIPNGARRGEQPSEQFFEWFMCSGKQQMRSGWWQVEVVYTNNEPVMCGEKPCNYKIFIK
ncbi:MAG: hypothetical protein BWK78_10325, partial [Thiotrichaceae bacterium IS1]